MVELPAWARAGEIRKQKKEEEARLKREAREARAAERARQQAARQGESRSDSELYQRRGPRSKNWAPGDVHGRLTLSHVTGHDMKGRPLIQCTCVCGARPILRLDNILHSSTKSCGCMRDRWLNPIAKEQIKILGKIDRDELNAMLNDSFKTTLHEALDAIQSNTGADPAMNADEIAATKNQLKHLTRIERVS